MSLFKKGTSEVLGEVNKGLGKVLNKEQGTRRLQMDMLSDNWLAKSIRPLVVIWCLVMMTVIIIFDLKGIVLSENLILTVRVAFWSAIGFYFPSRLIEKYVNGKRVLNEKTKK